MRSRRRWDKSLVVEQFLHVCETLCRIAFTAIDVSADARMMPGTV